ncbi:hypothetical protein Pmani_002818 [Petrolisthes manimaculis]|uniref:Phospholipid/glycerol acyltransferase domain-containing protein n=1 Tax=Petrolisthes manimaculis TaxID=1843537 RepID=A0AAE1UQL6_9EUCA|nr:hypothetical protein Pmani_002818 [Petrolisthes manimaculis]
MSWTQREYTPPKSCNSNTMTVPGGSSRGDEGVVVDTPTNTFKEYLPSKTYGNTPITTVPTTTSVPFNTSSQWAPEGKSLAAHIASAMPTPPESPPPTHLATSTICDSHHHEALVDKTTRQLGLHNLLRVSTSNADRYWLTRRCCYVFHCLALRTKFNYANIPNKMILRDDRIVRAMEQVVAEELEEAGVEEQDDCRARMSLLAKHTARANKLLTDMKAAISSTLIRITGYVLFKVFSNLLMSVTVHGGQQEVIDRAAQRDTPVIFVPLHRSHVDYLFVTWVLFNRQIPAPIVAAGDNLRIPVFGWLLRGLGGFFIKRRLDNCKSRKDILYRSLLQTYVTHALQAGYNLEFFIEGGRTRTGKPCMPKGGLLSVIVDAYSNGTLDDALIVPIAINYDKILDGNFIREQMGQSKIPESFWGAVRAIMKVLSTNYGHARIDFGQPFSLREFVHNQKRASFSQLPLSSQSHNDVLPGCTPPLSPSPMIEMPVLSNGRNSEQLQSLPQPFPLSEQQKPETALFSPSPLVMGKSYHQRSLSTPAANGNLRLRRTTSNPSNALNTVTGTNSRLTGAPSSSSLFGTEVTDEYRSLVKSLAVHIVYDAERCQAVMATNAVAWLLSYVYREGVKLSTLVEAVDALRDSLKTRKRDTGFSGHSRDAVLHAVHMLGAGLVRLEQSTTQTSTTNDTEQDFFIRPVTLLPNIIELNYYASALAPLFAADAIIVTCLLSSIDCDLWSYKDCLPDCLVDREKLIQRGLRLAQLLQHEFLLVPACASLLTKLGQVVDNLIDMGLLQDAGKVDSRWSEDSDEDDISFSQQYKLAPTSSTLEVIGAWRNMLAPMLDTYYHAACCLTSLVGKQLPDKEYIQSIQTHVSSLLEKGTLRYGESICVDPIRNAVKLFESESIMECYNHNSIRLVYLTREYDAEDRLSPLISEIDSYRSCIS